MWLSFSCSVLKLQFPISLTGFYFFQDKLFVADDVAQIASVATACAIAAAAAVYNLFSFY